MAVFVSAESRKQVHVGQIAVLNKKKNEHKAPCVRAIHIFADMACYVNAAWLQERGLVGQVRTHVKTEDTNTCACTSTQANAQMCVVTNAHVDHVDQWWGCVIRRASAMHKNTMQVH